MARYGGGPVVHKALTGPRGFPPSIDATKSDASWLGELLGTLACVNGQVVVPAGGQIKVPTPRECFSWFGGLLLSFGLGACGSCRRW